MSIGLILCAKNARKLLLKANNAKDISLLSRNLKLNYQNDKLISQKWSTLGKTQPKLFQNCANWTNKQKPFSNHTKNWNKLPEKQPNFRELSYIVKDRTKTISKLRKLDKQRKSVFKPNYVQRINSFCKNCKKTSSENKQCQRNLSFAPIGTTEKKQKKTIVLKESLYSQENWK